MKFLSKPFSRIIITLFVILSSSTNSFAARKKVKTPLHEHFETVVKTLEKGDLFLGGKPPRLRDFILAKEIKKDGKYYYMYKALVDRASGDKNGSLILFKAKTYGDAIAKLLDIDPANKRLFDTFFPVSIDKTKFPPVKMIYDYMIEARNDEGFWRISDGVQKPKGDKRFIEPLTFGLQPGTYEIRVFTSISLGEHPVADMWDVIEWITFLMDPVGSVIESIAESTEYSLMGLAKDLFLTVLENKTTSTKATFKIEVLAKVPNLEGKVPSKAVEELSARRLGYTSKNTDNCSKSSSNKVISQRPKPGARLKKDKKVELTICREKKVIPDNPIGNPSDNLYAAWIRPDALTCCTTPDGIYTYAYQSGLRRNMPANGILLQGGFATNEALVAWVCGRPVYYHYWATNWASINGYTVSQLPCSINS